MWINLYTGRHLVSPLFAFFLTFLCFLLQTIYFLNDAQTLLGLASPSLFPEVIHKSSMFSWLRINKCADACGGQKEEWNNFKSPKRCSAHVFFPRKDLRETKLNVADVSYVSLCPFGRCSDTTEQRTWINSVCLNILIPFVFCFPYCWWTWDFFLYLHDVLLCLGQTI